METRLTAHQADEREARPLLDKVGNFDTTGGLLSLDEMLYGSTFQILKQGADTVGAYALQLSQHEAGAVLWVAGAAANVPGRDLSPHIFSIIEQQARQIGAAQVACTTLRAGLVKKLLALGFEVSGITLRKTICHATH